MKYFTVAVIILFTGPLMGNEGGLSSQEKLFQDFYDEPMNTSGISADTAPDPKENSDVDEELGEVSHEVKNIEDIKGLSTESSYFGPVDTSKNFTPMKEEARESAFVNYEYYYYGSNMSHLDADKKDEKPDIAQETGVAEKSSSGEGDSMVFTETEVIEAMKSSKDTALEKGDLIKTIFGHCQHLSRYCNALVGLEKEALSAKEGYYSDLAIAGFKASRKLLKSTRAQVKRMKANKLTPGGLARHYKDLLNAAQLLEEYELLEGKLSKNEARLRKFFDRAKSSVLDKVLEK